MKVMDALEPRLTWLRWYKIILLQVIKQILPLA